MKIKNIKFKAKQLNSGKWFEGDLVRLGNRVCIGGDHIKDGITDVDPSTVCMFTGLTDCNGKEVWEGDIVRPPLIIRETFKIEWDDFSCGFRAVDDTGYIHSPISSLFRCHKWVVVGNKFDKEK